MTDFIKIILYTVLAVIAVCVIIPLLCIIINWSTPYFNQFFVLLTSNPIVFYMFAISFIIIIVKMLFNLFD
jgi:hypothetical protein